jgi:hypothetical protein
MQNMASFGGVATLDFGFTARFQWHPKARLLKMWRLLEASRSLESVLQRRDQWHSEAHLSKILRLVAA